MLPADLLDTVWFHWTRGRRESKESETSTREPFWTPSPKLQGQDGDKVREQTMCILISTATHTLKHLYYHPKRQEQWKLHYPQPNHPRQTAGRNFTDVTDIFIPNSPGCVIVVAAHYSPSPLPPSSAYGLWLLYPCQCTPQPNLELYFY